MKTVGTFAEVRDSAIGNVGLVPTMGFLHEGHLALIDRARRDCDTVVMSLFINPLQFDESRDLARYPRALDRDADLAQEHGVDILFAPELDEMYPEEPLTRVKVSGVTDELEGVHRPGHFEGVATVVAKLFGGTGADRAYFGRKDAQQLATVTRMAMDLSMPIEVVPVPIVRERDGLALSSRNIFLTSTERTNALGIPTGLMAAADAAEAGERQGSRLESVVRRHLDVTSVDYVALAGASSATRVAAITEDVFLAVAAWVGETRLIDNISMSLTAGGVSADRGIRLDQPSILYGASSG